jgi:hypothetical protein
MKIQNRFSAVPAKELAACRRTLTAFRDSINFELDNKRERMPFLAWSYPLCRWLSAHRPVALQYVRPSAIATIMISAHRRNSIRTTEMPLLSAVRNDGTGMHGIKPLKFPSDVNLCSRESFRGGSLQIHKAPLGVRFSFIPLAGR